MEKGIVTKWDDAPNICAPLETGEYRRGLSLMNNNIQFIPNGIGGIIERTSWEHYWEAYTLCAPLQAIINNIAQCHANSITSIKATSGKGKDKESMSEQAVKIRKLLANPNPIQTQDEFEAQGKIFQKIFGFNIVYLFKGPGSKNIDAEEMWNIPACWLNLLLKQRSFIFKKDSPFESITLNYGGFSIPLNVDDCYIQRDFVPSFTTVVLPESRIRALSQPIANIILALRSRGAILHDRGPAGIISSGPGSDQFGSTAVSEEDRLDIQAQSRRYGTNMGQFRHIITKAALSFTPTSFSMKDMMFFEEIADDIMRICEGYRYPYRLTASDRNNSLGGSDVNDFEKHLYQDNIIPDSKRDTAFWNKLFECDQYGLVINEDFSDLPVLQEELINAAAARRKMGDAFILEWEAGKSTLNDWRRAIDEDPLPDPQFDMFKPFYDQWIIESGLPPQTRLAMLVGSELNNLENPSAATDPATTSTADANAGKMLAQFEDLLKKYIR